MKGFFAKLKDFSPKLKVSEILLLLMPQNRWKKACLYRSQFRAKNCKNVFPIEPSFQNNQPKSLVNTDRYWRRLGHTIIIDVDIAKCSLHILILVLTWQSEASQYCYWCWYCKVQPANIDIGIDIAKSSQKILVLVLILRSGASKYWYRYCYCKLEQAEIDIDIESLVLLSHIPGWVGLGWVGLG